MAADLSYEQLERVVTAMKLGDEIRFEKTAKRWLERMYSRAPRWLRLADVFAHRDYFVVDDTVGPMAFVSEGKKDNEHSAKLRLEGNKLYRDKVYDHATMKYSDSIVWATHDSKDLGMGYANISAICFTHELYEHALVSIALAKKYNYPEPLMPKLLKRESDCKLNIAQGKSQTYPTSCCTAINVATNPRIPFLANGISMKVLPGYGRSLVADRDFNAGDIILDEELVACAINPESKRGLCHHCTAYTTGFGITCPQCVSVAFCDEKCRDAGMKAFHRFECGAADKLDHISYGATRIGLRMFFHGLNLFNDDVQRMMEYCKANGRSGINPMDLDYTIDDPFRAFRIFNQTTLPEVELNSDLSRLQAALFYSVLIRQPAIKALISTQKQKDFMLSCLQEYIRAAIFLAPYHVDMMTAQLYTVGALCNHACGGALNTYAVSCDGRLKFVVLRPVRKGEQFLTSYTISFEGLDFSSCHLSAPIPCECICPDCAPSEVRQANGDVKSPIARKYVMALGRVITGEEYELGDKVKAMRTFIQRFGHLHLEYKQFDHFIHTYRDLLTEAFNYYVKDNRRLKSVERIKHY